jgi:hypothetical protein
MCLFILFVEICTENYESCLLFQYTCFNVSRNFLIFGATSGGLYVFKREPCIFLQLLPNKVIFFTL